jgi:hypothetical protein
MTSSHALSGKSSRARCAKNSGRRSARFRVQTITEILGRGVVSADATLGPAGEIASCDVVMCQSGAMLLRSSNPSSVGSSSAGRRKQIAWSRPQNRSTKDARRNFYTDDLAAMTQVGAESSTEFAAASVLGGSSPCVRSSCTPRLKRHRTVHEACLTSNTPIRCTSSPDCESQSRDADDQSHTNRPFWALLRDGGGRPECRGRRGQLSSGIR